MQTFCLGPLEYLEKDVQTLRGYHPATFAASVVNACYSEGDNHCCSLCHIFLGLLGPILTPDFFVKITKRIKAGVVVGDGDYENLSEAIIDLKSKPELREKMGRNARDYAEDNFKIDEIADRFEKIFEEVS